MAELFIVGIGASAGGLRALETLFRHIPPNTGCAFVVVQHLSPDFRSLMDDLLSRHTAMRIRRAEEDMVVEPDTIYLIPPRKLLQLRGDHLTLSEREPGRLAEMPVNVFFESLARTAGARAIAIVLSGTGSDGTDGVRMVHEAGGLVLVQDPESAEFDGMPRSAVASGQVDFVLKPEQMPAALADYVRGAPRPTAPAALPDVTDPRAIETGGGASAIHALLRRATGVDFSQYKPATIDRRVQRRMALLEIAELDAYAEYLAGRPDELDALFHDLLIGVTEFFRDPLAFACLGERVLPGILQRAMNEEIRIWDVGCATGQEAYSLTILVDEVARSVGFEGRVAVFATDVHRQSLETAALGLYDRNQMDGLSEERRLRYFREERPGLWRIVPEIRQQVVFARHNLISDPPFTRIDLISCRNLLIYFDPLVQDRALGLFHYALRRGGHMFLGSSEGLGRREAEFETIESRHKLYRKLRDTRVLPDIRAVPPPRLGPLSAGPSALSGPTSPTVSIGRHLLHAYDHLLSRHMPPGVLVNEAGAIVHYFGAVARFLRPPEGRADDNLLNRTDGDLRLALSILLPKVLKGGAAEIARKVRCQSAGATVHVDLAAEPIPDERTGGLLVHLAFREVLPQSLPDLPEPGSAAAFDQGQAFRRRLSDLESELQSTKENLQATVEELQTSNEELQATNEEMLAANEELQSTNEELHSVNEELYTVNAEFERKNTELRQLADDLDNLLASTDSGTVFLDRELRIRRFNPAIERIFRLLPQDVGRPIDHIAYHLDNQAETLAEIRRVLTSAQTFTRDVRTRDGLHFLQRILPFYGARRAVEGVVLTFTDITAIHAMQERLQIAMTAARLVWWEWDLVGNRFATHASGPCILGYELDCLHPSPDTWFNLTHPDDLERVRSTLEVALRGDVGEWDCQHRLKDRAGLWRWVHNKGRVIDRDPSGKPMRMAGVTQDIHQRRAAEDTERRLSALLAHVKELIVCTDLDGRITYWNEGATRILGYGVRERVGRHVAEHHTDPERRREAVDLFARVVAGTPFEGEWVDQHAEGHLVWLHARTALFFSDDGLPAGVITIAHDVSEQKRQEAEIRRLNRAIEQSPAIVVISDVSGRIEYVNPAFTTTFGYRPEEARGQTMALIQSGEMNPSFYKELRETLIGGGTWRGEILNRRRNGSVCWVRSTISPLKDGAGRITHFLDVCEDITAWREEQEARRSLERQLFQSQKLETLGTLAGGIAHDFNNILVAILSSSELLEIDLPEDSPSRDHVARLRQAATRARDVVRRILTFSRQSEISRRPLPLRQALDEAVNLARAILPVTVDLRVTSPPEAWAILADPGQFQQVLINLCTNAADALPDRAGTIALSAQFDRIATPTQLNVGTLEPGAYVGITVADNGVGMNGEVMKHIFDPFFTTKKPGEGTGLGLAVVQTILLAHHGGVRVESTVGQGSTFQVYFPSTGVVGADPPPAPAAVRRGLGQRILVVDDDTSVRQSTQLVLTRLGYEVRAAVSPEEALGAFANDQTARPDLLLTDQTMPNMSGYELACRVRENCPDLPIVIMTGYSRELTPAALRRLGRAELCSKPFSAADLSQILHRLLEESPPVAPEPVATSVSSPPG